jgi:hypothetical protein
MKRRVSMPKQTKRKPGRGKQSKGTLVKIHFPDAEWSPKKGAALDKHLKELVPELVKGLKERTGNENLANFNTFKESGPAH